MTVHYNKRSVAAALLASTCFATSALAQTAEKGTVADQTGLEQIVVTAQKRSESVQDIPLAVTAVGGEALRDRQVSSVESLSSIAPSINFGNYGGSARIAVRGIGFDTATPGAEGRVAYHLDGVYISRPSAQMGTFYDIERIEVLRGPQGTLYGRNATGGSINVISRAPTEVPSGYANITVGNYGRVAIESALSGQITEGASARMAVMSNNRNGYGKNEYSGKDIDDANQRGGRVTLRLKPAADVTVDLSADYYRENDHAYALHYMGQYGTTVLKGVTLGGSAPSQLRDINSEFEPENQREAYGYSGTVSWDLGAATLKSISAYRHSDFGIKNDLDETDQQLAIFTFYERARQYSQELQLSGKTDRLNWLVGAYYFNEWIFGGDQVARNLRVVGGPNFLTNGLIAEGVTRTRAMAGYGQIDYSVLDNLKLILGARYNHERISINDTFQLDFVRPFNPNSTIIPQPTFPRTDTTSNNAFTPKFGVEYSLNEDAILYATVSKGFKSGGFNLAINVPAFKPESIWAYESGLKLTTADRRLRANLAAFYYKYTNLQVTKIVSTQAITENAAAANLYGGELELTALPTEKVQLDGSISYLHARYKDYKSVDPVRPTLGLLNLEGNQLIQAPEWTVNAGAQFRQPVGTGSVTLRGEMNFMSRMYFSAFNVDQVSQKANAKFNAFLSWANDDSRWKASLFVRNITDKITRTSGLVASATYGSPITGSISAPRTFGVMVGYSF